jgi:prepilin-type processing-associated H-X9-DG protein/prepilin-type N-terminal cleavage/methylation domain-containing protein
MISRKSLLPTRAGVTLLEVLVVLTISAIILALLLPAVQQVRSAANRVACQSNLRQIAIAATSSESSYGVLPPSHRTPARGVSQPYLAWPILISSFLEQDNIWRQAEEDFRNSQDPILPQSHRGLPRPQKIFSCPTDTRLTEPQEIAFLYTLARPKPKAVKLMAAGNSYVGSAGNLANNRDGAIVVNGRVSLLSIADGISNTLLFGERPPSQNGLHGLLYVSWGVRGYGRLDSVIATQDPNPFRNKEPGFECGQGPFEFRQPDLSSESDCAFFQYWSLHNGGANFAFADGSVRFLTYSANAILPAIASRSGGESVSLPD